MAEIKVTIKEGFEENNDEYDVVIGTFYRNYYHGPEIGWGITFPESRRVVEDVERSFQEVSEALFGHRVDLQDRAIRHGLDISINYKMEDRFHYHIGHYPLKWKLDNVEFTDECLDESNKLFEVAQDVLGEVNRGSLEKFKYRIDGDAIQEAGNKSFGSKNLELKGSYERETVFEPYVWYVSVESSFEYLPNKELLAWITKHHRNPEVMQVDYTKVAREMRNWIIQNRETKPPEPVVPDWVKRQFLHYE